LKAQIYSSANNPNILASIGDAFHDGTNSDGQTGNGHARHFSFVSRHQTRLSVAQIDIAQNQRLKINQGVRFSYDHIGEPTIRTIRQ